MPETKRPLKVFLCHASADKPKVRELYRTLKRRGVQPWLDAENLIPGQNWEVEIPKALLSSDAIIICLSPNSVDKEGYVQKEINFALEKALEMSEGRIFIIPARLEDCDLPFSLKKYQAVNLYEKEGYTKLMRALRLRASQLERTTVQVPHPDEASPNLASTSEDDKKKEQEFQLRKLESQAIQSELKGDFWNARKTWYEIKQIDPMFPRVHIKIEELEREIAKNMLRETQEREAVEMAWQEKAKWQVVRNASIKKFLSKAVPFFRVTSIIALVIILFGAGLWTLSKIIPPIPTKTPTPTKVSIPTAYTGSLPTEINDAQYTIMILVPEGEFIMGNTLYSNEEPIHHVNLPAYYLDKYEVTNDQYKSCVDKGLCGIPDTAKYDNSNYSQYPIVGVNWFMAKAYCEKWRGEGSRLPSEAEWEKAARGPNERIYPWGDGIDKTYANYNNYIGDTTSVSYYEPKGGSPYGVYDMAGNVWEWVADWYSNIYYQSSPSSNPLGPNTGKLKVIRGGSWKSISSWELSTFWRDKLDPTSVKDDVGFRCARDANP